MARAVSLQQTVELVRLTVDVLEDRIEELAAPGEADWLRSALLRYSRELAFAAAQIYAQAAEARGAWDARLEALIVDAVLRGESDEALHSRASALGWQHPGAVTVVVGRTPEHDPQLVAHAIHRIGRHNDLDVLVGVQGERLVVLVGGVDDPLKAAGIVAAEFGPGPVVAGPAVPDLASATRSASAALSGLRAAAAWPEAPRPVAADDLLPERALAGDLSAKRQLVEELYRPLVEAGPAVLETVAVFLEQASSAWRRPPGCSSSTPTPCATGYDVWLRSRGPPPPPDGPRSRSASPSRWDRLEGETRRVVVLPQLPDAKLVPRVTAMATRIPHG